ncbi:hypothetical protein BC827DRAFT_363952 [Russula dissimulans]|jgi:hypothetical protein|nr:hypothetical protein BC827DRAFT_363952 [Russula dissimulans]
MRTTILMSGHVLGAKVQVETRSVDVEGAEGKTRDGHFTVSSYSRRSICNTVLPSFYSNSMDTQQVALCAASTHTRNRLTLRTRPYMYISGSNGTVTVNCRTHCTINPLRYRFSIVLYPRPIDLHPRVQRATWQALLYKCNRVLSFLTSEE